MADATNAYEIAEEMTQANRHRICIEYSTNILLYSAELSHACRWPPRGVRALRAALLCVLAGAAGAPARDGRRACYPCTAYSGTSCAESATSIVQVAGGNPSALAVMETQ